MSTNELIKKVEELKELKAMSAELAEEITAIEDELKTHMGSKEELRAGMFNLRWTTVKTSKLDTKALKRDLPELVKRYTLPSEYRRFIIA